MNSRNEFRYDLFQSDLPDILVAIEGLYTEISRPCLTTLTLYFCDVHLGPPAVDFVFRMRAYTQLNHAPSTLHDIRTLQWQAEEKDSDGKMSLGTVEGLPNGNTWHLFGAKRQPLALKICQRRHFAVGEIKDEMRRLTVDVSRSQYLIEGERLEAIGDLSPRVELKLPKSVQEESLPLTDRLCTMNHWMPFSSLTCYFQAVLRHLLPKETHISLPEIETKYAITSGSPEQVFGDLFSFLSTAQDSSWRLLLPFPHSIVRTRRYHVCRGLRPSSSATIVETASGRCSLKIKDDAQSHGSALLRTTQASHHTDINGRALTSDEYARASALTKLNEFIKLQRKVPIALANGHGFQFTVDVCTDPQRRSLRQLEIEYIGSIDGAVPLVD